MKNLMVIGVVLLMVGSGCRNSGKKDNVTSGRAELLPQKKQFQDTINGKATHLFYLKNSNNMKVAITNYGGRIVGIIVPDSKGNPVDVVLGFNGVQKYKNSTEPYFGALIGRVGNRIANGHFSVNGKEYNLPKNNGPNTLHGGIKGFQDVVWNASQTSDSSLILRYLSPDGEEGFPGNLKVKVSYSLTPDNGLKIKYEAATDETTPVNLTNHAFFNLNGEGSGTINNHILWVNADYFTPVDSTLIPTGELRPVAGTPFDFTQPIKIGTRLDTANNLQLKYGKGYDHNFVLNKSEKDMHMVAKIQGDKSGIVMEIFTDQPGLQFYGGNFMQSKNTLKSGAKDDYRTAFCLETQHFPDSPNHPDFPSVLLEKGALYHTVSVYKFTTVKE